MEEAKTPKRNHWPQLVIVACVVIIIVFITANVISQRQNKYCDISIGNNKIVAELAVTKEQMTQGLSGRDKLAEGKGMLFVYDGYYIPSFWMKDMKFPIDIIWIVYFERSVEIDISTGSLVA